MAKRSIAALQAKIDKETNGGGGVSSSGTYYPHWKLPKDGITRARLLEDPDLENDLIFYTEYKEHVLNIGDEVVRVPCLKNGNIKAPCPICELSKKYYDKDDKKNGKYYYRDLYLLMRGVVTKDGLEYSEDDTPATGQVKVFKFSWQLATALKAALGQFDDGDEPWDLDEGFDFQIVKTVNKTPQGDQAKYDAGSAFVRKSTSIPEEFREDIPEEPLSALIPELPSYDEAVAILQKHLKALNGELDDGDDDDATGDESDIEAKIAKQRQRKQEAEAAKEEESSSDLDDLKAEMAEDDSPSVETAEEEPASPLAGLTMDEGEDDDIDLLKKLKS